MKSAIVLALSLVAIGCRDDKNELSPAGPPPSSAPAAAPSCPSSFVGPVPACDGPIATTERTFTWTAPDAHAYAITIASRGDVGVVAMIDDADGSTLENGLATPGHAARIVVKGDAGHVYTVHLSSLATDKPAADVGFSLGVERAPDPIAEAPPPPVTVTIVSAKVKGKDEPLVKSLFDANAWRIRRCYERAVAADPTVAGKATLAIDVVQGGEARDAKAGPVSFPDAFLRCIEAAAKKLAYPEPTEGFAHVEVAIVVAPRP